MYRMSAAPLTTKRAGSVGAEQAAGSVALTLLRFTLMGCALASAAAALSMPFFQGVGASALTVVFLWGGFVSALYALGLTHLGERFTGHELASANSAFAILYAAGVMTGPALGGIAMDAWNPHGLIAILALIPAIFAVVAGWRAATIPRPGNS
jgi:predicted MFS family arabinose efflux permease